jgi:lysine decarboxylase
MVRGGEELLGRLIDLAASARARLREIDGLLVVDEQSMPGVRMDPAKLVVSVAGAGVDGLALEDALVASGHPVEMADRDTLIPLLTLADDERAVEQFLQAFLGALEPLRGDPRPARGSVSWSVVPDVVMPPREAFFARHRILAAADAVGQVSAELVAPYPPGVPVLAPGERITEASVAGLHQAVASGTQVRYAADPSLRTFQVVA